MKNADIREGLRILGAYVSGSAHSMCAEHDQIWFGPNDPSVVSDDDRKELEKIGWFVCSEGGRWSAFV